MSAIDIFLTGLAIAGAAFVVLFALAIGVAIVMSAITDQRQKRAQTLVGIYTQVIAQQKQVEQSANRLEESPAARWGVQLLKGDQS